MRKQFFTSAILFSALSFCTINSVFAQTSGMPSPVDGQPIEPSFNLGFEVDDRIPMRSNAYPWSAVGRVQTDGAGHCTGALIGRDLVLTNAHCIFVNRQLRGITFAPNYKNGQAPETVRGNLYWWGTDNPDRDRRLDWAIIRLERPIGDKYGWFGTRSLNYQELRGKTVSYVGYSTFGNERVPEFINGETAQVHIGCQIRDAFPDQGVIHTDCDNGRGGSGGPIFIWQNNKPYIVGINAGEFRGDPDGQSFFTQKYIPGRGNVGVPTLTFSQAIQEASNVRQSAVGLRGIVHLQNIGDVSFPGGTFAGKRGESRRLEGFSVAITDGTPNLEIQYMAHIQNIGDTTWVNGGQFIGTRGESRRLEGFAIRLTGSNAANYNIRYICHLQDIGDTQVRSNGEFCGTRGESRRLEGLQVWIERK